jgi:hypothetical protein
MKQQSSLSMPAARLHLLWPALLVIAGFAFSLGFACAMPFAAFAAAAALTLSRRDALPVMLAVWSANQLVGFALLGYPWTASTLAWGVAMGVAVVLATMAGQWSYGRSVDALRVVGFTVTFLVAFAVYELGLFAVAILLLGGSEDFTWDILTRIFAINAAACAGLLVLHRLGASVGRAARPVATLSVHERTA